MVNIIISMIPITKMEYFQVVTLSGHVEESFYSITSDLSDFAVL